MSSIKGSFANPKFKGSCSFAPFTKSELEEVAATDGKVRRHESQPAPVSPTLEELCDQFRGAKIAVEPTLMEPASTEAPEVVEPAPKAEPILVEGSPSAVEDGALAPRIGEEGASAEACPSSIETPSYL